MSDKNTAIDGARGLLHRVSGAGYWTRGTGVCGHVERCALNGRGFRASESSLANHLIGMERETHARRLPVDNHRGFAEHEHPVPECANQAKAEWYPLRHTR
jgi:hypothetical protein